MNFPLKQLVQLSQEMIECAIFGEFLRMEKILGATTSHPHIFFTISQNDLKNDTSKTMIICTCRKIIKVFESLLSILISTF